MGPFEIFFIYLPIAVIIIGIVSMQLRVAQFESKHFRIEEDIEVVADQPKKVYVIKGKWPRNGITYHTTYSLVAAQNWCAIADTEMDKTKA